VCVIDEHNNTNALLPFPVRVHSHSNIMSKSKESKKLQAKESLEHSPLKIPAIAEDNGDAKRQRQQRNISSEKSKETMSSISEGMALKKDKKKEQKAILNISHSSAIKQIRSDESGNHTLDIVILSDATAMQLENSRKVNQTQIFLSKLYKDPFLTLPPSTRITAGENWYEPYPTTLGLIVLLHVLFLYQWNRKLTKRTLMASYRILVQRKHYHMGVLAVLSHPPTHDTNRQLPPTSVDIGHATDSQYHDVSYARLLQSSRFFQSITFPILQGHLSGLPLLCYNSHILWSCRSLEVQSPHYFLELLGLAVVALLLELKLTHLILQITRNSEPIQNSRMRRLFSNRSMGSLTGLSAAIMVRYRLLIPYVPLQVFPILSTSWMDATVSYCFAFLLLTLLSWKTHPATSVWFGTVSGVLWTIGITSWLGEAYWGCLLIIWILVASLLSLHGSSHTWTPFVDYVAWDYRGRIPGEAQHGLGDDDRVSNDEDDEHSIVNDLENPTEIRGRIPVMIQEDDDSWTTVDQQAPRWRSNHAR